MCRIFTLHAARQLTEDHDTGKLEWTVMLPYLRAYMGHLRMNGTAYFIHLLPENLVKSAAIDWDALDCLVNVDPATVRTLRAAA